MKISEITVADVTTYLRLESGDYEPKEIESIMAAAKQYISSYTGIAVAVDDDSESLDSHEEFYIAFMVLCQDMHDNRSYYTEKNNVNKVVESILGMHCKNLL